jgi:hypothetical protein
MPTFGIVNRWLGVPLGDLVLISNKGVPMMPVVLTNSRQGGTPHFTKKLSDEASIHLEKFGKKTMPAGSQSPNITCTS